MIFSPEQNGRKVGYLFKGVVDSLVLCIVHVIHHIVDRNVGSVDSRSCRCSCCCPLLCSSNITEIAAGNAIAADCCCCGGGCSTTRDGQTVFRVLH